MTETPQQARERIRKGDWVGVTSGLCPGHVQANLVILPKKYADDFKVFCEKNPKPCPLLGTTAPGNPEPKTLAPGANVCTDLPKYRVWKSGKLFKEVTDVSEFWQDDMVAFFLGCSFGFEGRLQAQGIEIRNVTEKKNVSMYKTNIKCAPAGPFDCNMIVSMRPIEESRVEQVYALTKDLFKAHGPPIHHGDPKKIGIVDVAKVDFGEAVTIKDNELPVFWACGVTSTAAALSAAPDLMITHAPGHMFICDDVNQ